MCGIAGILTAEPGDASVPSRTAAMQRALAHRGPDDRGTWSSPRGHASFAHTRLAVIDPTPAARQPMSVDGGRLTLIFNGEVYNFMELRRELEQQGASFHGRADTEVVLRAYDQYGDDCVGRFRGMFAFAIWDEPRRRCLLARDRFGIKPLYYALQQGRLVFASEVRATMASGLIPPAVDPRAVYDYFRAGSVQEPRTLLSGIRCLEAGQVATWQDGRWRARRYWDFSFETEPASSGAVPATRAALVDSVEHHFVSDVPVGIFLSGGVDSTALLALAHRIGRADVRVLTMSMPGAADDELPLARRAAQHFGVRHDVCAVDAAAARTLFDEYLRAMDQPSIDGLNTLAVARLARESGLKVMMSGLGADELFGGYPSVYAVPKFAAWHRRFAAAGGLTRAAGRLLERAPDPRWRRVGDMLGQEPGLASAYATYRGIYTRPESRRLTQHYTGHAPALDEPDEATHDDPTPYDAVSRLELTRYLRNQLLRDADVMAMACGVEVRVPYIDNVVVDTVTRIDRRERLSMTKSLLLKAVPEIPEWIARQPKRGFMFPVESWLAGAWRDVFDDSDGRCPVVTGPWYRKWSVHAFEQWMKDIRMTTSVHEQAAPAAAVRGVNG